MSIEGILISVAILFAGVIWLVLPFYRSQGRSGVHEQSALAVAYERAILSVRELDEDYQMGKLPQEAYAAERAQWIERGAALLEALEKTAAQSTKGRRRKSAPKPTDSDPVEQAIAAYTRAREQN